MKAKIPEVMPPPEAPMPHPWEWSISQAWTWLGHTWIEVIHMPYLGLLSVILGLGIATAILVNLVARR